MSVQYTISSYTAPFSSNVCISEDAFCYVRIRSSILEESGTYYLLLYLTGLCFFVFAIVYGLGGAKSGMVLVACTVSDMNI